MRPDATRTDLTTIDSTLFLPHGRDRLAASALTTLVLIFGPDFFAPLAEGLEGRMQRVADPAYQLRAWTYFVHPFLVFTACLGVAAALRRKAPGLALAGILAFGLWATTEAAQQALTLFAFDDWRRAWLAGDRRGARDDRRPRGDLRRIVGGSLFAVAVRDHPRQRFFAAALLRMRDNLSRVVGAFFALAALQSIIIQSGELGGPVLPEVDRRVDLPRDPAAGPDFDRPVAVPGGGRPIPGLEARP